MSVSSGTSRTLLHSSYLLNSSMHAHAYDLVLLSFLLPCANMARVRVVGEKHHDAQLFVPSVGVQRPAARLAHVLPAVLGLGPERTARRKHWGRSWLKGGHELPKGPQMMVPPPSDEAPPDANTQNVVGAGEEPLPDFPADVFKTANWEQIEVLLNQLPVFILGMEGQPLMYMIDEKPLVVFQADVEAAKKDLAKFESELGFEGCDLIQVGLGSAFRFSAVSNGAIVPGPAEFGAAGVPEYVQKIDLPLFACAETSREGNESLPLFMSYADCIAAVEQEPHGKADAPLSIFSLPEVVATLASDSPANFSFVAPSASTKHIETFVGKEVAKYQEMEVDFFSRADCPFCDMAADMMQLRGLKDLNVKRTDLSSEAQEELERLGASGVPFFHSKKTGESVSGWRQDALTLDWLVAGLAPGSSTSSGLECPE